MILLNMAARIKCNFVKIRIVMYVRLSLLFSWLFAVSSLSAQSFYNPLCIPPIVSGTNFQLDCDSGQWQIYPGSMTNTFAVNGNYLGPTLEWNKGDSVNIEINNLLGEETSLHWHGLHIPAAMDGGPETVIAAGNSFTSSFRVMNPAATYWYHPHIHMNTEAQVRKGMAGLIIVRDTQEAALNLPRNYGFDDFPILLQDRSYDASNQFLVNTLGDSMLVNGTARPYLNVPGQMVRLRILNGSAARVYKLGFSDNRTFYVIGSDGGLLPAPIATNRMLLSNGERIEILVDFSGPALPPLTLKSYATEMPNNVPGNLMGMMGGNGPLERVDFDIMEFRIISPIPGGITSVPSTLVPVQTYDSTTANRVRNRTITGQGMVNMGNFYLDGSQYIMGYFNDTIRLGDIELWYVTNSSNISHPMHVHDVSFRILSRNGAVPPPAESGYKDVFHILPQETVSIIMRFEDYADDGVPYMYHCHNLAHEDMGMMTSFIVVDTISSTIATITDRHTMAIYPNPTTKDWNISVPHAHGENITVTITDAIGRFIKTTSTIAAHDGAIIPAGELREGIYLLHLQKESGSEQVIVGVKTEQ
jgi:bilirubin oxidase